MSAQIKAGEGYPAQRGQAVHGPVVGQIRLSVVSTLGCEGRANALRADHRPDMKVAKPSLRHEN